MKIIKRLKMENTNILEELEQDAGDERILEEIEESKSASKRSFDSVINNKKIDKKDLDEVMF